MAIVFYDAVFAFARLSKIKESERFFKKPKKASAFSTKRNGSQRFGTIRNDCKRIRTNTNEYERTHSNAVQSFSGFQRFATIGNLYVDVDEDVDNFKIMSSSSSFQQTCAGRCFV